MPLRALDPSGNPVDLEVGVTPVFRQLEPGLLRVVGTGFYVARYGLLLTAKHVIDDLVGADGQLVAAGAWNWTDTTAWLRTLAASSFHVNAPTKAPDIAICQALAGPHGAFIVDRPNERIGLTTRIPPIGAPIATYAYPGNHEVDGRAATVPATIHADVYEGQVLRVLGPEERPFIRYPHVESTMEIRSGASGGPTFGDLGHAFGVNCRGWDLDPQHQEGNLSSIVPVEAVLDLPFAFPQLHPGSPEDRSVPPDRRGAPVTLRELASWGHILLVE